VDTAGETPTKPSKTSLEVLIGNSGSMWVAILPAGQFILSAGKPRLSSTGQIDVLTVPFRYPEHVHSTLPKQK